MKLVVKTLTGKIFAIEAESIDTTWDLKMKIESKEGVSRHQHRLVCDGKGLENHRAIAEYNIVENSTLYLIVRLRGGDFSTQFVDLGNKDALQRIAFTYAQGQKWSRVTSGLNIEGKCKRKSCQAYGKRVISLKAYCNFNITADKSRCPVCGWTMKAITCGFADCEWMYSGRKRGSAVEITSTWQKAGLEYERFREAGNVADWEVLIIRARPDRSPKPQCVMCLYDITFEQEHQILQCGCRFHSDCVAHWKTRETHCPTCRVEMCRPKIAVEGSVDRVKTRNGLWRLLSRFNLACTY